MKKYQYLYAVEKHINYIFDRKKIVKELEEHIDDNIEELIHEGYSEQEAEIKAVEMMGNPHEVGKELNKLHNPFIGYMLIALRLIVIYMIYILISSSMPYMENTIKMLSPIVSNNSVEVIRIDDEIKLSSHKLILDNLCITDKGQYVLTYRCFRRYDYTRTPEYTTGFVVISDGTYGVGNYDYTSLLGFYGEKTFNKPVDEIVLEFHNHEQYILKVKEYKHE